MRKNGLRESTTKFCSENECSRGFYARGLCHKHYQAWRRTDSFTRVVFEERTCTLDGCEKKHHAAGYCQEHLDRLGRHGDPRKAIFRDGTSITKEVTSLSGAGAIPMLQQVGIWAVPSTRMRQCITATVIAWTIG